MLVSISHVTELLSPWDSSLLNHQLLFNYLSSSPFSQRPPETNTTPPTCPQLTSAHSLASYLPELTLANKCSVRISQFCHTGYMVQKHRQQGNYCSGTESKPPGLTTAQEVSQKLLNDATGVQSQVNSCEKCGEQSGTGAHFLKALWFYLAIPILPNALVLSSLSPRANTIRLSLTPPP